MGQQNRRGRQRNHAAGQYGLGICLQVEAEDGARPIGTAPECGAVKRAVAGNQGRDGPDTIVGAAKGIQRLESARLRCRWGQQHRQNAPVSTNAHLALLLERKAGIEKVFFLERKKQRTFAC